MKRDSRLSTSLHALLHMAEAHRPLTSEDLAAKLDCNAVVVRRTMSGLRRAKLVRAQKGHGGGWTLARGLDAVSLADVYDALGEPALFAMGNRTESPGCLVEVAVNRAITGALRDAEALVRERFRRVTLATIAANVRKKGGLRHAT